MKKSILHLVPLMALAFASLSCAKEKWNDASSSEGGDAGLTLSFQATVPEELDGVRTYIDDNSILWQTGDKMAVAITPAGASARIYQTDGLDSSYDGKSSATFTLTLNPLVTEAASYSFQGIHPASALVSGSDLTACQVELPSAQDASGSAYDPSAYILVAEPVSQSALTNWTFSFRRAVALNELTLKNLPDGVDRVEIVAPEGVYLSGGRTINLTTGASGAVYAGSRRVEVNYATPLSSGDQVIRFTSWGATIAVGEELTVLVYTSTKSYTKAITIPADHPITFVENKLNQLTVDMDAELAAVVEKDRYFSGGNGTADSPWRIASSTDLNNLASYISVDAADTDRKAALEDDFYLQTADIDFNNGYLESIGNSNSSPYSYFKGTYLGNGYKVSKAKIRNQQSSKAVGFFGYLAGSAHIDGLQLQGVTINATTWNNGAIVGCVQGNSSAVIENCVVTSSSISSSSYDVGGLVGKLMSGVIRHCSYSGTVSSTQTPGNKTCVAGICGLLDPKGSIIDCHAIGVTATASNGDYVGGIVGRINSNTTSAITSLIEGCTVDSNSSVTANKGYAGGILGGADSKGLINLCSASCDVSSTNTGGYGWVGGIVGSVYNTSDFLIANSCYTGGNLSNSGTSGDVAGIAGSFDYYSATLGNITIFNCCAFPTSVSTGASNANIAGITGLVRVAVVRNCYCPTAISAFNYNGSTDGSGSRGSIYGWMRGYSTDTYSYEYSAKMLDVYWLSGWKAGNKNGNWKYLLKEQSLTDAQMQNTGSVTRPSTGVSYDCFIDALNADVAAWNASSPLYGIEGVTWVMGSNGYPVPSGTTLAPSL